MQDQGPAAAPEGQPARRVAHRPTQPAERRIRPPEKRLLAALEWLRSHQSPDGSWDCDAFSINCDAKRGAACSGRGAATFDAGVTGLALLAFLGAGYDSQLPGPYLDTVRNGLKYLKNVQDAPGLLRADLRHPPHLRPRLRDDRDVRGVRVEQAAPLAQVSAEAGDRVHQRVPEPLQGLALRQAARRQRLVGHGLDADGAQVREGCRHPVNDRTMKDGLAFLDSLTDEDTGRTGYIKKGELPVRPEGLQGKFPATESEALTAVTMCSHGSSATRPTRRS